jgi:hypothetical protein
MRIPEARVHGFRASPSAIPERQSAVALGRPARGKIRQENQVPKMIGFPPKNSGGTAGNQRQKDRNQR